MLKYANSTSVVSFHVFNINVSWWFLFSFQYHVAILTIIEKLPGIAWLVLKEICRHEDIVLGQLNANVITYYLQSYTLNAPLTF